MNLNNPFLERLGVELVDWRSDYVEMSLFPTEAHGNRTGIVQGGVIATLMDAGCGYSGLFSEKDMEPQHAITIMLAISYVAPGKLGERIRVVGKVTGRGRRIYFASAEARNEQGFLIASAQGSFKRRSSV